MKPNRRKKHRFPLYIPESFVYNGKQGLTNQRRVLYPIPEGNARANFDETTLFILDILVEFT